MAGIHSYAVHVPRLAVRAEEYRRQFGRCAARIEDKRVPDHDEDEVTLAIAAARALAGLGGPAPGALLTASDTAPPFGAYVAEALGLGGARVAEHRGPTSGLAALLEASGLVAAGQGAALVVSADAPAFGPGDEREHGAGAAATAWLLTAKGPAQLRRAAHASAPVVGAAGGEAALAEALAGLTRAGLGADSVVRAATHDLDARLVAVVQRALPKARVAQPGLHVGEVGATSPLLGLARALEEARPGEAVVVAAAGAGLAIAASLEAERAPALRGLGEALAEPAEALDYARHARLRGWLSPGHLDVSQGAAVSAAQYLEGLAARLRWEGQRCRACSRPQFPPREACAACGGAALEPLRLSGRGTVHSIATIGRGSAPAEFAEQQRRAGAYDVAIAELEEGPRVAAQVADAPPGRLRIGDAVKLVVRRLYTQDAAPRYGFKARPAGAERGPHGAESPPGPGARG